MEKAGTKISRARIICCQCRETYISMPLRGENVSETDRRVNLLISLGVTPSPRRCGTVPITLHAPQRRCVEVLPSFCRQQKKQLKSPKARRKRKLEFIFSHRLSDAVIMENRSRRPLSRCRQCSDLLWNLYSLHAASSL